MSLQIHSSQASNQTVTSCDGNVINPTRRGIGETRSSLRSAQDDESISTFFGGVWESLANGYNYVYNLIFGPSDPAAVLKKFQDRAKVNLTRLINDEGCSYGSPIKAAAVVKLNGRIIASHFTGINKDTIAKFREEVLAKTTKALEGQTLYDNDELSICSVRVQPTSPEWTLMASEITESDNRSRQFSSSSRVSTPTSKRVIIQRISTFCEGSSANNETKTTLLKYFLG